MEDVKIEYQFTPCDVEAPCTKKGKKYELVVSYSTIHILHRS